MISCWHFLTIHHVFIYRIKSLSPISPRGWALILSICSIFPTYASGARRRVKQATEEKEEEEEEEEEERKEELLQR